MDITQVAIQDSHSGGAPAQGSASASTLPDASLPSAASIATYLRAKRVLDILASGAQLVLFAPLMLLIAFCIKLFDGGPVFFRQERLTGGPGGPRTFQIIKFRSMVVNAESLGSKITARHDPRITPLGRLLRASKLDELPQLINILCGDMSFVGPRPQTLGYVEQFRQHYYAIHSLVPAGLTDLATLKYRDEGRILSGTADPERVYIEQIMPDKIVYHYAYLRQFGPLTDLSILLQTLYQVFVRKPVAKVLRKAG